MRILTLLDEARAAGINVRVEGDRLIMSGPRRAAPIMDRLGARKGELLAALHKRGLALVLAAFPGAVVSEADWVTAWAAEGAHTGHEWLACDVCGEIQLLRLDKVGRPCRMTPRCDGLMRRQHMPAPTLPQTSSGMSHPPPTL